MKEKAISILVGIISFIIGINISGIGNIFHENDVIMGALTSIIFAINILIAVVISCTILIIYTINKKK